MCPQAMYMPLTGIEPGTFQSADQRSTTEPNQFRPYGTLDISIRQSQLKYEPKKSKRLKKHFTKEDIGMANKHMKNEQHLVTEELQIKTTRYLYTANRIALTEH